MPPKQAKPGEPLTFGDRVVTALLGGLAGFGTMILVWLVVMYLGGRRSQDESFPFYWTWIVALAVAAVSFVAGPERTMDAFDTVWGLIGKLFWRKEDSGFKPRSGKRR